MFLGRRSLTRSLTLSTWISLEQKHCHFIKCLLWCVFVSDSCYLRIGCRSCSTVETLFSPCHPPSLPALLKPALTVSLLSFSQWCTWTTPAASPRREGRNQGRLIRYHNPTKYSLKKATKSCYGEDHPLRTFSSITCQHNCSTSADFVWDRFYTYVGGFII